MALSAIAGLIDQLRGLHLLEDAQIGKLKQLQARFPDKQALIKKLLEHRWITPFQANVVAAGKGEHLLIGSYLLLERLGEGGMGEVYKARNWKLGRTVALKVIRKDKALSQNAMRRFRREVEASSQLRHPNIVLALDAGEVNGRHYLAMEYVDGTDLAKRVREQGPLPVAEACALMRQAAYGLEHAREQGMVHRDIKPSNLLQSRADGMLKILDMGLARMNETETIDDEASTLTQEGSVLGTVDYLSPEQAMDARKADTRSDLYSLGCTFYFLLTGKVPFPGGTATEKLLKHRLEEPIPIDKTRPDVPPAIAGLVRKLMAKKPDDRYQTPAQLAAALDAGGVAPARSVGSQVGSLIGKIPMRWKLRLGGALAACLAVVLIFNALSGPGGNSDGKSSTATTGSTIPAKAGPPPPSYVKRDTREDTILATLKASGYPTLEGKWYSIGYFDNSFSKGIRHAYPPEQEVDLSQSYKGKDGMVSWREFRNFQPGHNVNLAIQSPNHASCIYLYHEMEVAEPVKLPLTVSADDSISLWLNRERIHHQERQLFKESHPEKVVLDLKPGKNTLLIKVCNLGEFWAKGEFWVNLTPHWPDKLEHLFGQSLRRDFGRDRDESAVSPR